MSWQIAAIISTLLNHLSHCGSSLIKKYSCPPNLDTLEMDKCHLCLGIYSIPDSPLFWSFECNVLWFFAWMSAVIKSIYILQEGKVCPNIPITMQQARSLCDKNVCHVSPATSGKKMFYRYIIISQIDPIQPCL